MDQFLESVKEFINQYPKTKLLLLEWQRKNLVGMQEQMSGMGPSDEISFPPITDEMVEHFLYVTFVTNHRFLYDFFDEAGLRLFLNAKESKFGFDVNGENNDSTYSSRTEAEQAGFKVAMEKLEKLQEDKQLS